MSRIRGAAAILAGAVFGGCGENGQPTVPDLAFPAAPPGFILSHAGDHLLIWTWIAVPGAAGYAVQVKEVAAFGAADPIHTTEALEFFLGELRHDTEMYARVAAYTGSASSPSLGAWTAPVSGRTRPRPPYDVQVGFAARRRAVLFEGGTLKAALEVHGEISNLAEDGFELVVVSDAPDRELVVPDQLVIRGHAGRNQIEIRAVADAAADSPATYGIRLAPPPGGLPPGITLVEDRTTFQLTLRDAVPQPDCSALLLSGGPSGFNAEDVGPTAEITFEGPEHAGLRIEEPYHVLVGNGFRWLPWPAELVPTRLTHRRLAGGRHRQTIALTWTGDLRLTALARGCKPVTLTRRGPSATTGARRLAAPERLGVRAGEGGSALPGRRGPPPAPSAATRGLPGTAAVRGGSRP